MTQPYRNSVVLREFPAEWAPQSGVMLTWPHPDSGCWPEPDAVDAVFVMLAQQISRFEKLLIVCQNNKHRSHITTLLDNAGQRLSERAILAIAASNDCWARDHAPISIIENGRPLLLDFQFNGWGGKYPSQLDNQLTPCLHRQGIFGATARQDIDFVLEGGSIESDGAGTLLTTARCLLSPQRNPHQTRQSIDRLFQTTFGIKRILWLEHGWLAGDDTDGHIDMLARFCSSDTIAYVRCEDSADEHYQSLRAMAAELHGFSQADGTPYRLVPLPMPASKYDSAGRRLPASYANFLIINHAVLMPVYDDSADASALAAIRQCFPHREIIAIPCLPLIQQNGSLHCVTMQLPAGII